MMIAVFAAMTLEVAGFERRLADRERAAVGGYPVCLGEHEGKPVLVCRTGIGRRAEAAARAVLDRYQPGLVLSVGVGGALNPEFRAGDVVLCESVGPASSGAAEAAPVCSNEGLLRLAYASAEEAGLRVWRGQSLTVDRVVGEPAEKDALRRSSGMDVVEMESYWVGLVAQEKGLSFLAARTVLDELADTLPVLPGVVQADGSRRAYRALPYVLRHPSRVPRLLSMAVSERRAVGTLTRFLEAFVSACEMSLGVARPA
jgi:adenosylhomocysteine nucleosidase